MNTGWQEGKGDRDAVFLSFLCGYFTAYIRFTLEYIQAQVMLRLLSSKGGFSPPLKVSPLLLDKFLLWAFVLLALLFVKTA